MAKTYDPKKTEKKIYALWEKSGFFNPDKLAKSYKKSFTIFLPPPNITGELHMGHALNAAIQDILIRWKKIQGYKALWLPGIDHAGIATQNVVEKQLKKQGISRFDLGREKFLEKVWQWKKKYGNIILEQFKKLGCSLDWSRTAFTMDKDYYQAVIKAFLHYYEKGWIYQGKRVVNWCSRCQTSLSDLELEYKKEKGHLWYIKYPLVQKSKFQNPNSKQNPNYKLQIPRFIAVATTRPETMLGDTAVAVNPNDERYKKLVGQKVILPLTKREVPIIADKLVDPKFGTGAVKVTPAHSLIDYEISLKHDLLFLQVIDGQGRIMPPAPFIYQGLRIFDARKKILGDLEKLGLLEKIEDYDLSLPKCYRCETIVELIPSEQWFLKMNELARVAINAVKQGKVKFYPKNFEKGYFGWLSNVRDWCLSRQIWWGHQLPVFYCGKKQEEIRNQKSEIRNNNNRNFVVVLKKPKKCPFCKECSMKQSEEVLDTWFSSALWPLASLGWPKKTRDLKNFYPSNILSTARDIINLWAARMIFSGIEFMKKPPFKNVYVHPTVVTKEGKRMSKSLGTGVDPLNLVEKYGADAVRFGISYQIMGSQDIRFTEDNIIMGKKFCNKIWNAARFVLLQIGKFKISPGQVFFENLAGQVNQKSKLQLTAADKKILKALDKTIKSINKDLENFRFGQATHTLYNFFWHDFCDIYIEKSKNQLSGNNKRKSQTQKVLIYTLLTFLKLLHPFMPFITEEIYQKLPKKNKKALIMIESWPS